MKQNGKELKVSVNIDGNRDAILAQIHSLMDSGGGGAGIVSELSGHLSAKEKQKRAGR